MTDPGLTINEVLESFDFARRPIKSSDRVAGDIPYLGASGIVDFVSGSTHDGDFLCVSEDGENLRSRNTPIAWVQRGQFWANNHVHVLGGAPLPRLRFFAYALNGTNIASHLTGSAQPKLSQQSLNAIRFPRFDAEKQTAIGEVLGALDDKRAANRRLQDVARSLAVSVVADNSDRCSVRDLATAARPLVAPAGMADEGVTHFSLPAFDRGFATIERARDIKSSKLALNTPVVLVSKLNPRISRIWPVDQLPAGESVASTEFVPLTPKSDVAVGELWAALSSPGFSRNLLSHVAGTTGSHQRVKPADVLNVTVADVRTLDDRTRDLTRSLCRTVNQRTEDTRRLTAAHDELLQLLMTGRITVRDAERRVEDEV